MAYLSFLKPAPLSKSHQTPLARSGVVLSRSTTAGFNWSGQTAGTHACHIAAKEMVPIVIAASLWGPQWHRRCVRFRSDNMAVVDVLRSRTSRDPILMHLLRCLVFYAAVYHFDFMAEHLPGTHTI